MSQVGAEIHDPSDWLIGSAIAACVLAHRGGYLVLRPMEPDDPSLLKKMILALWCTTSDWPQDQLAAWNVHFLLSGKDHRDFDAMFEALLERLSDHARHPITANFLNFHNMSTFKIVARQRQWGKRMKEFVGTAKILGSDVASRYLTIWNDSLEQRYVLARWAEGHARLNAQPIAA